jgi:hypothetical protein
MLYPTTERTTRHVTSNKAKRTTKNQTYLAQVQGTNKATIQVKEREAETISPAHTVVSRDHQKKRSNNKK